MREGPGKMPPVGRSRFVPRPDGEIYGVLGIGTIPEFFLLAAT